MPTLLLLVLASSALFQAPPAVHGAPEAVQVEQAAVAFGRDWLLRTSDNVCGLRDANQLTNPAVIDFDSALAATPEMKKIESQGIDPSRLSSVGYGETKPIDTNRTPNGRAKNRRVEFHIEK